MKKFIKICLIIIMLGIIINVGMYFSRRFKNNTNDTKLPNVSINKKDTQQEEIIIKDDEENNELNDYYGIDRENLDRSFLYAIGNTPQALPHYGLYGADYIYEIKAEGGLTRLLAVFDRGNVEKIGPIRSARHNFLDISMEYDAIFSHFGGSPKAFEEIKTLEIPGLNGIPLDGLMYWRDKSRIAPDNAYTSIKKSVDYAKKYGFDKKIEHNHFDFYDEDTQLNGYKSTKFDIKYSYAHSTSYIYDEANKVYKRYMKGNPHIDNQIDSQLTAKNVIVQFARHYSIDQEDRQDIKLVGSGMGFYFTNGEYINITWEKTSRSAQTKYYDEDGNTIKLNKGQTWIQVVPLTSRVNIRK